MFFQDKNRGKGAAQAGFREARSDIVVIQDADLEYDPSVTSRLIAPIERKTPTSSMVRAFSGGPTGSCCFGIMSAISS